MLLHETIYHDLFYQIATKQFQKGDMLPSEKELMNKYQCSLAPIRQAMGRLEQLGLVERLRGKGTFVKTNNPVDFRLDLVGFTGALYAERNEWTYRTRCVKLITADDELARRMEIAPGAEVVYAERIGWFKDKPIQYSKHYMPRTEYFQLICDEGDIQFWRYLLEGKLGISIVEATDEVYADLAEGEFGEVFPKHKGHPSPMLVVERTSRDRAGCIQDFTVFYLATFKAGEKTVKHKYIIRQD